VKLIILAAGRGKRMQQLTEEKHKCLTIYRGRPLIEWSVENSLKFFKPQDILIIGGYRFSDLEYLGLNLKVNDNWANTNIVGSLLVARNFLQEEECIIVYSDIYFEPSALSQILSSEGSSVLSLVNWLDIWRKRFINPLDDLESFKYNITKNVLLEIGLRPKNLSEIQGQFGGIIRIHPSLWKEVESKIPNLENLDTTTLIQKCLNLGINFNVVKYDGHWAEFDNSFDVDSQ
jgi:choline kinase